MPQPSIDYVFMSYSRRDDAVMRRIVAFLRGQGIKVWVDNEELIPGTPVWEKEIEIAVQSASAVVVVLSPDSKDSEWVRREISLADQYDKRVFPLMVRGDEKTSISIRLIGRQYVDIRSNEDAGLNYVSATLLRYLEELNEREQNAKKEADRLAAQKIKTEKRLAARKAEEERIANEKVVADRKAREDADRLAAQKANEERIANEKNVGQVSNLTDENEKHLAAQKADEERITLEKVNAERKAREDADRLVAQKVEKERIAFEKVATERKAKETPVNRNSISTAPARQPKSRNRILIYVGIGVGALVLLGIFIAGANIVSKSIETANVNSGGTLSADYATASANGTMTANANFIATAKAMPTMIPIEISTMTGADGATLVYVPAGEFTMGSDYSPDEQPIHKVNLPAFWIDQTEVTTNQYAACISAGKCDPPSNTDHFNTAYANYPVVDADWKQAKAYCEWAGRRMPTEAEWEKAARGTDGRIYPWGNDAPSNSLLINITLDVHIAAVGKIPKGKSPYGAYDMAGNVWEWVNDWYNETYYQSSPLSNPLGPNSGQYRVVRGGSTNYSDNDVRSASRDRFDPTYHSTDIGFRCASSEANAINQAPTVTVAPIATQAPALGIGSNMTGKDGMTLLYVPAGEFTMGSDVNSDEQPIHKVYLDAFWIDQTEVTNKQYKACVDAGTCEPPSSTSSQTHPNYYGNPEFDDYPLVWVSWDKANRYCEVWIGGDLPTEAQWEKAARGTDTRSYPWGNEAPNKYLLNYNGNIGDTTLIKNYPNTASFYGTYDMAGNVSEWVNDFYSETYYQSSASSNNPLGPESGQSRVLRGGSWDQVGTLVRSALRGKSVPMYAYVNIGFRCSHGTFP
jgi:formylglycine-generating enzyme required for sulfatase activity